MLLSYQRTECYKGEHRSQRSNIPRYPSWEPGPQRLLIMMTNISLIAKGLMEVKFWSWFCVFFKIFSIFQIRHDDEFYSKVEYILLDPSCSGSGIVSRMDDLVDEQTDAANQVVHFFLFFECMDRKTGSVPIPQLTNQFHTLE